MKPNQNTLFIPMKKKTCLNVAILTTIFNIHVVLGAL